MTEDDNSSPKEIALYVGIVVAVYVLISLIQKFVPDGLLAERCRRQRRRASIAKSLIVRKWREDTVNDSSNNDDCLTLAVGEHHEKGTRADDDIELVATEAVPISRPKEEYDDEDTTRPEKESSSGNCTNERDVCAICLDEFQHNELVCKSKMNENCTHCFHEKCMKPWLMKQSQCPMCRETLLDEESST